MDINGVHKLSDGRDTEVQHSIDMSALSICSTALETLDEVGVGGTSKLTEDCIASSTPISCRRQCQSLNLVSVVQQHVQACDLQLHKRVCAWYDKGQVSKVVNG